MAEPNNGIQSTQDKYRRVNKSNEQTEINANEVRITTKGRVKRYVDYATNLFKGTSGREREEKDNNGNANDDPNDGDKNQPLKKFDTIVLKATGKAINKAVTTAEVVKRTVGDLHQETSLETLEIVDVWEPTEEGLQKVETTRRVASITIKLSRNIEDVDEKAPGYQKPIAQETGFPLGGGYRTGGRGGGPRRFGRGGGNFNRRRRPYRGGRGGGRGGFGQRGPRPPFQGGRGPRGGGFGGQGGFRGGGGGFGGPSPNRRFRGGGGRRGGGGGRGRRF